jgi:hypothetical protein
MIKDNGVVFTNLNGQSVSLNNDTWPLKEFTPEVDIFGEEVKRMQEPGIWPNRTVLGKMLMHCGGDLLLNDAYAYITERMRAMQILVPAGIINNERKMGTITLLYDNFEPMYNDCTLDAYPSLPMQALYPSVTEFSITFKVFDPFLIGRNTGRFYSI